MIVPAAFAVAAGLAYAVAPDYPVVWLMLFAGTASTLPVRR